MNQPQSRPQMQSPPVQSPSAQSLSTQSSSPTISDDKLSAAAAVIGQVTNIQENYQRRIAEAPTSEKQRLAEEANDRLQKAVTDQGLTVDEYNTIIRTVQNDPAVRQKLSQRVSH